MTVTAIIQARMNSRRLPEKVMKEISGKAMLWYVVKRLEYSKKVEDIIIATTKNPQDDAIEEFCKKNLFKFFRGSETDVLDRYFQCASEYEVETVVRITADCPLIDPKIVDKVVGEYKKRSRDFDGASNIIKRRYPIGLDTEVLSFESLEKCWENASRKHQREHVTQYIYENPDEFKLISIENNADYSGLRWTVDEIDDLEFIRQIYKRLYDGKNSFGMRETLETLEKEPYLKKINQDVKHNWINP